MSTLKKVSSMKQKFEHITAMVNIQNKIILAARLPRNYLTKLFTGSYNIYLYSLGSDPVYLLGGYRNVPDMTKVKSNKFALIDGGSWFYSQVRFVEVIFEDEIIHHEETSSFQTDKNCCGITFFDNHLFLAYSDKEGGYIKMLDEAGDEKSTFSVDLNQTPMFSATLSKIGVSRDLKLHVSDYTQNQLSKIEVSDDIKLHVSDVGQNQLIVVKLSMTLNGISEKPSIEAEHNRMAANSIIQKGKNELFLAIGGMASEIVLMSTEGPKKVLRQHEITGVPTALCIVDDVLYVATRSEGWFSTSTHIFGFKDKDNKRPEQHLISTQNRKT